MKKIFQNKFVRGVLVGCFGFVLVAAPLVVAAQDNYNEPGLVKCVGALKPGESGTRCDFAQFIVTIKYLINWMIYITIPVAIVLFAYAGFLFMTAKESNISKAKGIFTNIIIGLFFMLGAWLIVHTILRLLVRNDSYLFFFK